MARKNRRDLWGYDRRPNKRSGRPIIKRITSERTGEVTEVNEPTPAEHGISLRVLWVLIVVVSLTAGFFVSQPHDSATSIANWLLYSIVFCVGIPIVGVLAWEFVVGPSEEPAPRRR